MAKTNWFMYLKRGLCCEPVKNAIGDRTGYADRKENLRFLKPFLLRHWRKGLAGAFLLLISGRLGLSNRSSPGY
jgi:hypothetical protein